MSSLPSSAREDAPLRLSELAVGESARITAMLIPGTAGERLMEMGLTPGTELRLVRRGLWGDPLQIQVRGYMLTLRKALAQDVRVTRGT